MVLTDLVCGEPHVLVHSQLCPHMEEEGEMQLSEVFFYKGTNPIHEGPAFMTQSPTKGPTSKSILLGIRFQLAFLQT